MTNEYIPPKVWTNDNENGGQWASINRPDSGAEGSDNMLPTGANNKDFERWSIFQ